MLVFSPWKHFCHTQMEKNSARCFFNDPNTSCLLGVLLGGVSATVWWICFMRWKTCLESNLSFWFLPRQAAILQQTADYIFTLEQEKTQLLTQNNQLKHLIQVKQIEIFCTLNLNVTLITLSVAWNTFYTFTPTLHYWLQLQFSSFRVTFCLGCSGSPQVKTVQHLFKVLWTNLVQFELILFIFITDTLRLYFLLFCSNIWQHNHLLLIYFII